MPKTSPTPAAHTPDRTNTTSRLSPGNMVVNL